MLDHKTEWHFGGFSTGSEGRASACNAGDWVWSLGQEDPLEKAMAPHSSTLAWKIPWMEEPGRLQSMESQRVGHDWAILVLWYHCKVIYPIPYLLHNCSLWKKVTMYSLHLQGRELYSTSLRERRLHKFFCSDFSVLSIYLFIQTSISVCPHGYFF